MLGGVTCVLMNLSSSAEIEVTVARLTEVSVAQQAETLTTLGGRSPFQVADGVTGAFLVVDGVPTGQFVAGNYWVSLSSSNFRLASDVSLAANLVVQGL
jgi:hypothetical protein